MNPEVVRLTEIPPVVLVPMLYGALVGHLADNLADIIPRRNGLTGIAQEVLIRGGMRLVGAGIFLATPHYIAQYFEVLGPSTREALVYSMFYIAGSVAPAVFRVLTRDEPEVIQLEAVVADIESG